MFTVFRGGQSGAWRVTRFAPVKGAALVADAWRCRSSHSLTITLPILPSPTSWRLAGVASHLRYTERAEKNSSTPIGPRSAAPRRPTPR